MAAVPKRHYMMEFFYMVMNGGFGGGVVEDEGLYHVVDFLADSRVLRDL